jgi:hypothetical protein
MLKKTFLLISIGAVISGAYADDSQRQNKYNSPKNAHQMYLDAIDSGRPYHEKLGLYSAAAKQGSVEATIAASAVYFWGTEGAKDYKTGLDKLKPVLKYNDSMANYYAYSGYSRSGNQNEARKFLELEKAKSDNQAWFNWNYARYTGNGFFNAPYEPKKVCDEAESKYMTKNTNVYDTYLVGRCYFDGVVRSKDEKKGVDIFNALESKVWAASDTLGILYTVGTQYTPQDNKKARDLFGYQPHHIHRLPETSYYYAISSMQSLTGSTAENAYVDLLNAASFGVYEAQWLIDQYPKAEYGFPNFEVIVKVNPPQDPQLPKDSPRLPAFAFQNAPKSAKNQNTKINVPSTSSTKQQSLEETLKTPRFQQLKAYLAANKILSVNQTDLEGCKQAKIAYNFGKFKGEADNIYEESGVAYAICLGIGKEFRALHKNPTALGYQVLRNLDQNHKYAKARTVIGLYDRDLR